MTAKKSSAYILVASISMLILILDAKTAFSGASEGISLCLTTVIPSLFPFFVISILLTGLLPSFSSALLRPLGKVLHLPQNAESLSIIGFLGGYPVGAQCIRQAHCMGALSRNDAERMLAYCSNAGPAFIFGIGAAIFHEKWICWLLWLVHILSAFIVGWLTPSESSPSKRKIELPPVSVTEAVSKSLSVMGVVCSWVILFRVILAFLEKWFLWMFPKNIALLLCGLLELANGCTQLVEVPSVTSRFFMFSVMLGFGGLCVTLQTHAILFNSGLSFRPYILGKTAQGAVSALLCTCVTPILPDGKEQVPNISVIVMSLLICVLYRIYCMRAKKDIAFRRKLVYNEFKYPGGSTYEAFSQKD